MRVRFHFFALMLAAQAFSAVTVCGQQPEKVEVSKATSQPEKTEEVKEKSDAGKSFNGPILPASAFLPSRESTVQVAVAPTLDAQLEAKDVGNPNLIASQGIVATGSATEVSAAAVNATPLPSLLGFKTVPTLAPLKQAVSSEETVTAVSPPVFGPPQLPSIAKMSAIIPAMPEATLVSTVQDPVPMPEELKCPTNLTVDGTAPKIELSKILGELKTQEEIFGNLRIDPSAITTEAVEAPSQRLQLADGSLAAWQGDVYCWTAPNFFHNPLYFEQVNLERYGQGTYSCLQPAASGVQFFATIPILPYKIGGQEWSERVYTLGHRRPGNRNPYQIHYHPFSWTGVTYQAAASTGVVFIVP